MGVLSRRGELKGLREKILCLGSSAENMCGYELSDSDLPSNR